MHEGAFQPELYGRLGRQTHVYGGPLMTVPKNRQQVSESVIRRTDIATLSAAAAVLVLAIPPGVLGHDGHCRAAGDDLPPKTANGQYSKTLTDNKRGHAIRSRDQAEPSEVRAALTSKDSEVRASRVARDRDADWLPFNHDDIRTIAIFDAIETGSGKKLIARVPSKYHGAVFECMARSQPPGDDPGFDCVWTRETVIELNDGKSFVLNYDGECDAPEYHFQRRGANEGSTRWSRRLKGLLGLLESGKVRVRFVRLERDARGAFAVAGSCVHTASLGIPSSSPDGSGYRYAVHPNVEADGTITMRVEVTREVETAGASSAEVFAGIVRLSEAGLSTNGHDRVLRSGEESILLMTVQPHNR